jgi:protein SCO1/2
MISFRNQTLFVIVALSSLILFSEQCGGTAKRYQLEGKIIAIDQSKHQLIVSHSDIPGFMPAMIMPFNLKDPSAVNGLSKGDEIAATLVVKGSESWLENLRVVRKSGAVALDPRDAEIRTLPHEGDVVPDFTLTNQNGKKISLGQYRGKALLLTFIYTRCPLPDYCPLMSSNFAQIDKTLQQEPALLAKTHLLSISFDWQHDTPAVLRSYGAAYTEKYSDEKFEHWEFASGSADEVNAIAKFFGLQYEAKSDQIVHLLVTAIISPDGKIARIYSGNEWRPADVLIDLRAMKP